MAAAMISERERERERYIYIYAYIHERTSCRTNEGRGGPLLAICRRSLLAEGSPSSYGQRRADVCYHWCVFERSTKHLCRVSAQLCKPLGSHLRKVLNMLAALPHPCESDQVRPPNERHMPLEGQGGYWVKGPVQADDIWSKAAVFGEKRLEPGHTRIMPECHCLDKFSSLGRWPAAT